MKAVVTTNASRAVAKIRALNPDSPRLRAANRAALERTGKRIAGTEQGYLRESVARTGRPQRSGERLVNAIVDSRNRRVTSEQVTVNVPSFLDEQAPGYWRNLNRGSDVHVGRRIVWFYGGGVRSRPSQARLRQDSAATGTRGRVAVGTPGRINRPIPAYRYIDRTRARVVRDGVRRDVEYLRQEYAKAGVVLRTQG